MVYHPHPHDPLRYTFGKHRCFRKRAYALHGGHFVSKPVAERHEQFGAILHGNMDRVGIADCFRHAHQISERERCCFCNRLDTVRKLGAFAFADEQPKRCQCDAGMYRVINPDTIGRLAIADAVSGASHRLCYSFWNHEPQYGGADSHAVVDTCFLNAPIVCVAVYDANGVAVAIDDPFT